MEQIADVVEAVVRKTSEAILIPVQSQLSEILKKQNEHGIELKEVKSFLYDPDKGLVARIRDSERTIRNLEETKQTKMDCRLQTQKSNSRLSDVEDVQAGRSQKVSRFSWLIIAAVVAAVATSIFGILFRA